MKLHELLIVEPSLNIEGVVCRSTTYGVSAESSNEIDAINFVKGAMLCALGELWRKIPDEITIVFEIDRSALMKNELQSK